MKPSFNIPLTVATLSWGFNFVALKTLYQEMEPPVVALTRYFLMGLLLAGFCLWRKESLIPQRGDFWRLQAVGFVALGFYMVLFMEGMRGTTPAEGAIVLATSPIFTYLLSCLARHEKFVSSALVGCIIAFLGVTLVILGGSATGHGSLVANLTILAASLVWAVSAVMMKPLLSKYSPSAALTMAMPGALPALVPYGLLPTLGTHFERVTPSGWFMFSTVTVLSGGIAFACFYTGLRQVGASGAGLYQYFIPPTAALFAWLLLAKPLGPVQFMGLAIVLGGVVYAGQMRARAARLAPA